MPTWLSLSKIWNVAKLTSEISSSPSVISWLTAALRAGACGAGPAATDTPLVSVNDNPAAPKIGIPLVRFIERSPKRALGRPDEFAFVQFEFDAAYQQPLENSHTGPQLHRCIRDGQMAASDYVPIYFKNRIFRNAAQAGAWGKFVYRRIFVTASVQWRLPNPFKICWFNASIAEGGIRLGSDNSTQ
jgi:hypothetical protein